MPRLSCWIIRSSLIDLALGAAFGALMLANKGLPFEPRLWLLLTAHIELMFYGWMTQFAMGVAFWILPRFATSTPRGDERLIWFAFGLLNLGLWIVVVSSWRSLAYLEVFGKGLELTAWLIFLRGVWRRIYPFAAART
ncbi:MAG: hypothetical protein DDG59_07715 [Anaerolineae bacterium]|jgi:heme/copper-type cytochrome/quinol oxidase subunit 1|nr:MAG: hypothetical protein DDG59_07715 [Anaerolineae bacterium]